MKTLLLIVFVACVHAPPMLIENHTCIKLMEYIDGVHTDFIRFTKTLGGCYSSVGKQEVSKQYVSIGKDCFQMEAILHELDHAIEKMRPDRNGKSESAITAPNYHSDTDDSESALNSVKRLELEWQNSLSSGERILLKILCVGLLATIWWKTSDLST